MNILNYVQALLPRIDKSSIMEDIRITKGEFDQIVLPTYEEAAKFSKVFVFKSADTETTFKEFNKNYRSQLRSKESNTIAEIGSALKVCRANLGVLEEAIEKLLEETSVTEVITARKAVMLRAAEQFSFISRFATDFLNLVYTYEHMERGINTIEVSVYATKFVIPNIANFARLLETYSRDTDMFTQQLDAIPEVIINKKGYDAITSLHKRDTIEPFNSAALVSFQMNPIYHFRLMIAEWQANRYKSYKDKKKALELKLLNLKLLNDGKKDIKVEKEITYIEERVASLEYSIAKMQESVA